MNDYMTNDRYQEMTILRTFLHEGEELRWTGRPYASVPYRPAPTFLLSALFVLGFSVFWMAMAAQAPGPFFLFGTPFLLMGVYLVYNATVGTKRALKRTLYAVTDRRVLIIRENRRGTECSDYVLSRLCGVDVMNLRGNAGSIRLRDGRAHIVEEGHAYIRVGNRRHAVVSEASVRDVLLMIDNVESVYRMISEGMRGN